MTSPRAWFWLGLLCATVCGIAAYVFVHCNLPFVAAYFALIAAGFVFGAIKLERQRR